MSSLKRLLFGSVLVFGLTIALGRDAKANLTGFPCSADVEKDGGSNAAYTAVYVSVYSQGGCGGTYQGSAYFYSSADCTQASGCPAYNNQLFRFSDPVFSQFLSQLSDATFNWRRINIGTSGVMAEWLVLYGN